MNIPVLIVACGMLLVVLAHVFGGSRDTARIEPQSTTKSLTRNWVQAMCAFQMLSVDLLAVTGLLFAVALWDLGAVEDIIVKALIVLFCSWGVVWTIQTRWLKRPDASLLQLPHWMIWLACASILLFGL